MVRDQAADVDAFRRAYAAGAGDEARLPAFAFGDTAAMADELAALVREGRKRATAALVADLERDGDPVPEPGDRAIILDGRGRAVCVAQTVDVRVGPLGSVDPAFAWDEGEGDRTREDWLDAHRRFYARCCDRLGLTLSDDLPVVFERFAVAWPEPDAPQPIVRRGDTSVRALRFDEAAWVAGVLAERWAGPLIVTRGRSHEGDRLPGLVAARDGRRVGLATFRPWPGGAAELVSLDALEPGRGHGHLLLEALEAVGRREGWRRLWAVTTNDNTVALRCYQRAGWDLAALHRGAVDEARRLKPAIPERGLDGIPLRHEVEVVRDLA